MPARSARDDFNFAVDAVDDVERALIDLAFVLGDGAILALLVDNMDGNAL